jgi:hypothetical protein
LHAEITARRPIKEQQEATKIQASNTKHTKISIRVHCKKHKPKETEYKILNEENTNLEDNTWPYNGRRKEINKIGTDRKHKPWGW